MKPGGMATALVAPPDLGPRRPRGDIGLREGQLPVRGGRRGVAAVYGGNYSRLRDAKRRYDPENVLHLKQNIAP